MHNYVPLLHSVLPVSLVYVEGPDQVHIDFTQTQCCPFVCCANCVILLLCNCRFFYVEPLCNTETDIHIQYRKHKSPVYCCLSQTMCVFGI